PRPSVLASRRASSRPGAGLNPLRRRWMMCPAAQAVLRFLNGAWRGKVRGHGGRAMQEERKNGGNGGAESGEPQFTTPGAGEQLDETGAPGEPAPGPMEGQAGERAPKPEPAQPRPRRKSAAKRKGGAKKAAAKVKKGGAARKARGKGAA